MAPYIASLAQSLDRRFHWDRLPLPLGIFTLYGLRHLLRQRNLYDSGRSPPPDAEPADRVTTHSSERTLDGRHVHPEHPDIGAAGTRFGRNAPVVLEKDAAHSTPAPEAVSEALLQRADLLPATSLNLLAAAWLQFEVHDWFAHQVEPEGRGPLGLAPLRQDPACPGRLPVYLSDQTHWWDASQLYGANERFAASIRGEDDSGKVKVDDDLLAAIAEFVDPSQADSGRGRARRTPDPVPNLWSGLAMFHVLFAREHNAICDRLREAYPGWTGDRLYGKARLINAAVMAKIHTVEWTPALIAHPTTVRAIRSTWWGLLGERFTRRFGRIGGEILTGIPGSRRDDDVPYSLTEEFAAVYRMHPLLPDEVSFHSAVDGSPLRDVDGGPTVAFEQLTATPDDRHQPRRRLEQVGYENAWYSLAISHPGALTLHNHPNFKPQLPSGDRLDLGAADILRTRECAIPRYNAFRRSLRLPPARSFRDLADGDSDVAAEIEQVYGEGRVEDVDLVVGLLADRKPAGFAISDTAFRIFLLMAARRLRSDPFFTTHYNPAVYTQLGLDWIDDASMAELLRRHYPALQPALRGVDNVFQPWPPMAARP